MKLPPIIAWILIAMASIPAVASETVRLGEPVSISKRYGPGDEYMGIRFLGMLRISPVQVDGLTVSELSALGWDEDAGVLYALSDSARLFHFVPEFTGDRLTGLRATAGYRLRDVERNRLSGQWADSEGLALQNARNGVSGDTELLVSFEAKMRIAALSPQGRTVRTLTLPPELRDPKIYASNNKRLEAVAVHPELGILTAPEWPLRGAPAGLISIHGLNRGRWQYPLSDAPKSALVALQALPDGTLLSLERSVQFSLVPVVTTSLRRSRPAATGGMLEVEDLAVLSTSDGWRTDNFEGLAWHRDNRFFIVSDDNRQPLQRTLLLYFEVL